VTAGNATGDGEGLAARLARWADGLGCVEWAVAWVIATGWTDDPEFVATCVVQTHYRGELVACMDWHAASRHAQQTSAPVERALAIGLACDLATEPWRRAGLVPVSAPVARP
jgi:dsRNA-specific ribonuclease